MNNLNKQNKELIRINLTDKEQRSQQIKDAVADAILRYEINNCQNVKLREQAKRYIKWI